MATVDYRRRRRQVGVSASDLVRGVCSSSVCVNSFEQPEGRRLGSRSSWIGGCTDGVIVQPIASGQ